MERDNENKDSPEISSSNNISNDENSSNSSNLSHVAKEPDFEYFDEMYTNLLLEEKY